MVDTHVARTGCLASRLYAFRLQYDPLYWGAVFPLGMCSLHVPDECGDGVQFFYFSAAFVFGGSLCGLGTDILWRVGQVVAWHGWAGVICALRASTTRSPHLSP